MKTKNLLIMLLLASNLGVAYGSKEGGGGYYGKVNGKLVLLDDLEEGKIINPENQDYFRNIEKILNNIKTTVPMFAKELLESLDTKSWHLVPFELTCEDPNIFLQVEKSAGACQNENDVWIEQAKYDAESPEELVLHELIQAVRLKKNDSLGLSKKVQPSAVRAIKRLLTQVPFPKEQILAEALSKYGFGDYSTSTQLDEEKRALDTCNNQIKAVKVTCNSTPKDDSLQALNNSISCIDAQYDELRNLSFQTGIKCKLIMLNELDLMNIKQTRLEFRRSGRH